MSVPTANPPWYLARDGEQYGPISEAEMAKLVELGHLQPNDLLWRDGFPDWRPALVVFPPHAPTLEELGAELLRQRVTTLWLTAGLFHPMVESQVEGLRGLRRLLAGGDVLSAPHVRRALAELPGLTLINGYGPTENTTFTCCHPMRSAAGIGAMVPIGRSVANTSVVLLDRSLRSVPPGVPGELCAGGAGLAQAA